MKPKDVKYPSPQMCRVVKNKAWQMGYSTPVDANLNQLGIELAQTPEPSRQEEKTWRLLKDVRRRQTAWRSQERQKLEQQFSNINSLDQDSTRQAAKIFVDLKERKCSYGDSVFNFAFPAAQSSAPEPVILPENLPEIIWQSAEKLEENFPLGLPMARIDALRNPATNKVRNETPRTKVLGFF